MFDDVVAWLYVPAIRPELFAKALASADGLVVDLEDAVHPDARPAGREKLKQLESIRTTKPIVVRVNPVGSRDFDDDMRAVEPLVRARIVSALRLAKTENARDATLATQAMRHWGNAPRLICLLESARAVKHADEVAAVDGVHSLGLGEGDLRGDLRLPRGRAGDPGVMLARQLVVLASRAAGLPSPVAPVFTHVTDMTGLQETSRELKALGYFGRSCIHPRQVDIVRRAFLPTTEERDWSAEVLALALTMESSQNASATLADGSFVDPAIVAHAQSVARRSQPGL
jgi:citrate lyase subunit beta/citryl-CoA lyase